MTKRKKYFKEFKLDAIALVVEQNYSQAEASSNLTPEQEETRELKAQVKRLEMEREIFVHNPIQEDLVCGGNVPNTGCKK